MLNSLLVNKDEASIYAIDSDERSSCIDRYIVSTPESRMICNDPFVVGNQYTKLLRKACTSVLTNLANIQKLNIKEQETIVFHILRGGLNFGLREALADAYGWNCHGSAFISAQRARISKNSEDWHITESHYKKVYTPKIATAVFGDVVATGTSLKHAINELVKAVKEQDSQLKSLLFFTIGGKKSEEIICEADKLCRDLFPEYQKSSIIYFEGRFEVADKDTPLFTKITGTDLIRRYSLMAPEFVESQYEQPSYPIERCTIYDAGSRAFWLPEYMEDVLEYCGKVNLLAESGINFENVLTKRFPDLERERFGDINLNDLSKEQMRKAETILNKFNI
ncbi:MAG TPA: hypothetical protein QF753_01245 [Victivallales bacterium]|nr:hypothetical protein [Victivallales bacterium]